MFIVDGIERSAENSDFHNIRITLPERGNNPSVRKINLPLILDTAFAAVCAFLVFFTAIRYYTKNVYIALGFAVCALALFGALCFLYISRKQNKRLLLSRNERKKKLLALHLSLISDGEAEKLVSQISHEGEEAFYRFEMAALDEDDVAAIIKRKCDRQKTLYCCKISPEAELLAEDFGIKTVKIDGIYDGLEEKNLLPEKFAYEKNDKISLAKRIRARFTRKLCAPLFWSGAALLAMSYFTFFPVYYIISGGILLILSAVALVIN